MNSSPVSRIIDHVRSLIDSGELRPGDRLPTERELANNLRISRASLRRGFDLLSAVGVIDRCHGRGTFASSRPSALAVNLLSISNIGLGSYEDHALEARLALEPNIAGLAALRGNREHLTELAELLAEIYKAINSSGEHHGHIILFHGVIANAAGNPVLTAFIEATIAVVGPRDPSPNVDNGQYLRTVAAIHREIYFAIRSRDPQKAARSMRDYLNLVRTTISSPRDAELFRFKAGSNKS